MVVRQEKFSSTPRRRLLWAASVLVPFLILSILGQNSTLSSFQYISMSMDDLFSATPSSRSRSSSSPRILVTNSGWNHPNRTLGLHSMRVVRSQQLFHAVTRHPWYFPVDDWQTYAHTNLTDKEGIRHYVFADVETCGERNWPVYGSSNSWELNSDREHNRSWSKMGSHNLIGQACGKLQRILATPLFHHQNISARLVLFNCQGNGPTNCVRRDDKKSLVGRSRDVSLIPISATESQIEPTRDIGMLPPPVRRFQLSPDAIASIRNCQSEANRTHLLTFKGNFRADVRKWLLALHRPPSVVVVNRNDQSASSLDYKRLLTDTKFAAVPRGDNPFSYRLTEVISAGAIPVIYADGWHLPFSKSVVDWSEIAIVIREADYNQTVEHLNNITDVQRCRMRQRLWSLYETYMNDVDAEMRGYIESLEHTWDS